MVVSFPRSACEIPGWSLTHPKGTTTWHLQILCRFSLCVSYQLHHIQLTNTGFHSLPQTELASLAAKLLVFQTLVLAKSTGTGGHMQECCRCPLFLPAALAVAKSKYFSICYLPLVNFQSPTSLGQFCPVLYLLFCEEESSNSSCSQSWKSLSCGYLYAHPHFTHEKN